MKLAMQTQKLATYVTNAHGCSVVQTGLVSVSGFLEINDWSVSDSKLLLSLTSLLMQQSMTICNSDYRITPVLRELHWLPIRERVKFKVACLVRQTLSGQAPVYLADDCCLVSDSNRRSLRSADVQTCMVPRTYSSYGDRIFAAAGPRFWNSLPVQLRNPEITYRLFRRHLKGHVWELWTRRSVTSDMQSLRKTFSK